MKTRMLLICSLLLCFGLMRDTASAQTKPVVCLTVDRLETVALLPWDAPLKRVFHLHNTESVAVTIDSIALYGEHRANITVLPVALPMVIPPLGSDSVAVLVAPYDDTAGYGRVQFFSGLNFAISSKNAAGTKCSAVFSDVDVYGYPYRHRDTRFVEPSPQELVEFVVAHFVGAPPDPRGYGDFSKRISIVNNTDADLTYSGASITGRDAIEFTLDHVSTAIGSRLLPGDSLFAFVSLQDVPTIDSFFATLTLSWLDHTSTQFDLNGILHELPGAVGLNAPTIAELSLLSNPTTGKIDFEAKKIGRCTAQLLDLLGRSVAERTLLGEGRYNFPAPEAKGAYLLRLSGVDVDGNPMVVTRRVVVE